MPQVALLRNSAARVGICPCRQCRRQCKIFASGVNFSIFTHFLCFFLLKLLKLGEIVGVKFLAWKSGGVKFWTNSMSAIKLNKIKSRSKGRLGVKMLCIHFHLMPMMTVMIPMIILLWMLTIYCHRGFIGWLRLHWAEREMATIGKGKAVSSNKDTYEKKHYVLKTEKIFEWKCFTLDDHFV